MGGGGEEGDSLASPYTIFVGQDWERSAMVHFKYALMFWLHLFTV